MRKLFFNAKACLLLVLPLILVACVALFAPQSSTALADDFEYLKTLPLTDTEVYDFSSSSPKDALHFGNGCALIKDDKTLWFSIDEQPYFEYPLLVHKNPIQIKRLSDHILVVNDDNILYFIDLNDLTKAPTLVEYQNTSVQASYFDVNSNYLVTFSGNTITRYQLNNGVILADSKVEIWNFAEAQSPTCVDQAGNVFFINSDRSVWVYSADQSLTNLYTRTDKITHLLTDGKLVFMIEGGSVKSLDVATKIVTEFTLNENPEFDLGVINKPVSISFNGTNLFISDSDAQAVCEYAVNDTTLNFTGFAIAKNKTAFNRVANDVVDLERFNGKLAILSSDRVTVIDYDNDFSPYNKEDFLNLTKTTLSTDFPQAIAMGNGRILFAYNNSVKYYDLATDTISQAIDFGTSIVKDVCYQSGYFYVLVNNTVNGATFTSSTTHKINEQTFTSVKATDYDDPYVSFTVDVFGNEIFSSDISVVKMASDVKGQVFAFKDGAFYLVDNATGDFLPYSTTTVPYGIKTFAIGFENSVLDFFFEGSEFMYSSTDMPVTGINGTKTPSELITTGDQANGTLRFVKPSDNSNVYSVNLVDGQFVFDKLVDKDTCYIYICDVPSLAHSVLLSSNGLVLCSTNMLIAYNNPTQDNLNLQLYVTTDVNAYYLPVITPTDDYILRDNDLAVRLTKGDQLLADSYFEFGGRGFYLVEFEKNSTTYQAFVPKGFTTTQLSKDFIYDTYTLQTVRATKVYSDKGLKTAVYTLVDGQSVKVYDNNGKVATIRYFDGQQWLDGYINQEDLQNKPNKAIRNTLIVLAVIACASGTTTYFLMRKKKED